MLKYPRVWVEKIILRNISSIFLIEWKIGVCKHIDTTAQQFSSYIAHSLKWIVYAKRQNRNRNLCKSVEWFILISTISTWKSTFNVDEFYEISPKRGGKVLVSYHFVFIISFQKFPSSATQAQPYFLLSRALSVHILFLSLMWIAN